MTEKEMALLKVFKEASEEISPVKEMDVELKELLYRHPILLETLMKVAPSISDDEGNVLMPPILMMALGYYTGFVVANVVAKQADIKSN